MPFNMNKYNRPYQCSKCGGELEFKGVGEYECEKCGNKEYDNYGKVRLYVEEHRGATAAEISDNTGVAQREIRDMLREARLEVTSDSKTFLHCEICSRPIRSGRFCPECEKKLEASGMQEKREKLRESMGKGYAKTPVDTTGEKRFKR